MTLQCIASHYHDLIFLYFQPMDSGSFTRALRLHYYTAPKKAASLTGQQNKKCSFSRDHFLLTISSPLSAPETLVFRYPLWSSFHDKIFPTRRDTTRGLALTCPYPSRQRPDTIAIESIHCIFWCCSGIFFTRANSASIVFQSKERVGEVWAHIYRL